jgi:sigma-B regulation protein RsbQ
MERPMRAAAAILLAALGLLACSSAAPPAPAGGVAPRDRPRPLSHDAIEATIASSDGVPIRYHAEGRGEPALVLIHGWACDRSHWAEQVDRFGAERQVIALDLAGHGDSGRNRQTWTIASLGEDVRAVVLALDVQRVVLVGHSMGGPVALEAAARMPGRVVAVVGVDTFHNVERRADPTVTRTLMERWKRDFPGTARLFVDSLLPGDCPPALRQRLEDQLGAAPPEIALPLLQDGFDYDLAAAFDRVHVPIRAINTTSPTDADADRRHAPDFAVIDLAAQRLGHFPMLTVPQLFDQKLAETLAGLGIAGPVTAPAAPKATTTPTPTTPMPPMPPTPPSAGGR